jgi:hypothetical protein
MKAMWIPQDTRITTFMRDESGDKIAKIEAEIEKATKIFPENQYKSNHYGQSSFSRKEQDTCSTIYFRH